MFSKFFKKQKQPESHEIEIIESDTKDLKLNKVSELEDPSINLTESVDIIEKNTQIIDKLDNIVDILKADSDFKILQEDIEETKQKNWLKSLRGGLEKTRNNLGKKLLGVFGGGKISPELYDELETTLLSSDIGIRSTKYILDEIRNKVTLKGLKDANELKDALKNILIELLTTIKKPLEIKDKKPHVIMLVGVNGSGKTTTIGKLTKYFQQQGKSVILGAADTFRAAAREQLIEWGKRNNVVVISQENGDPASVAFDTVKSAFANNIDIVLIDTAGRLSTQTNLMEEIKKIKRITNKALNEDPHETLLILDSNIGQNALSQLKAFDEAIGVTGLIVTKLDGTAKGGVICAIAKENPVPLLFIGIGEKIDDLREFDPVEYVNALID